MLPFKQASLLNEKEVVQKAGKERINDFLRTHMCYDLLKHSAKVRLILVKLPSTRITCTFHPAVCRNA